MMLYLWHIKFTFFMFCFQSPPQAPIFRECYARIKMKKKTLRMRVKEMLPRMTYRDQDCRYLLWAFEDKAGTCCEHFIIKIQNLTSSLSHTSTLQTLKTIFRIFFRKVWYLFCFVRAWRFHCCFAFGRRRWRRRRGGGKRRHHRDEVILAAADGRQGFCKSSEWSARRFQRLQWWRTRKVTSIRHVFWNSL